MALPTPPPYTNPIPNNPFYSLPAYVTRGAYYPITVGSGLNVDPVTAIMTSSGGGGGGVTGIFAGTGINVSASTGNVTITNTGVTSVAAGSGISVSTVGGVATVTNLNAGTVTSVNTGPGLTGGPFSTSGTISLASSGVSANTYTNPTITVDIYGRILNAVSTSSVTSISVTSPITISGTTTPTIGILPATTSQAGAVQLSDSVADAASVCAATTAAVKTAYDLAAAAIPKSCITAVGTLVTGTGPSAPLALPVGTNGQILAACSTCTGGLYWASTNVPPFGTPNYGSFYDITPSVPLTTPGTGQAVALGQTAGSNGISIQNTSEIHFSVDGTYNVQFSLQFEDSNASSDIVEVWVAKNGAALAYTNSKITLDGAGEAGLLAANIVDTFLATDYVEIYWGTVANTVTLSTLTSNVGGPDSPNAIVTVVPVGA